MSNLSADDIKRLLGLTPLGFEGGFYKESYRNPESVAQDFLPKRYTGPRSLGTGIFYMLTPRSFSLMHRLKTTEIYHFYLGDPAELLMLYPDGRSEVVHLGPDLAAGQRVQHVVPEGVWQGSRLLEGGTYALMGTTMAPGFELADFELGARDALAAQYPEQARLLNILTPARVKTKRLELAAATIDLLHAELRSHEALSAGLNAEISDWPPPLNDETTVKFTLERLESDARQRGWWSWYVMAADARTLSNTLIGLVGYKGAPDATGTVEIGCAVLPAYQNRGYATEACEALIAQAWNDPRVQRVVAATLPDQNASTRVLEKLGFQKIASPSATEWRFERLRTDGP